MHPSIEDENKALLHCWFEEVWNRGREELIEQLRAPDTRATGLGEGNRESLGYAPFRAFYSNLRRTFPDLHVTVEDIIAEGDKIAVRISMAGTHMGDALGTAAHRPNGQFRRDHHGAHRERQDCRSLEPDRSAWNPEADRRPACGFPSRPLPVYLKLVYGPARLTSGMVSPRSSVTILPFRMVMMVRPASTSVRFAAVPSATVAGITA